jgi:hypothetical protein
VAAASRFAAILGLKPRSGNSLARCSAAGSYRPSLRGLTGRHASVGATQGSAACKCYRRLGGKWAFLDVPGILFPPTAPARVSG